MSVCFTTYPTLVFETMLMPWDTGAVFLVPPTCLPLSNQGERKLANVSPFVSRPRLKRDGDGLR